jgi:hypothetical protein
MTKVYEMQGFEQPMSICRKIMQPYFDMQSKFANNPAVGLGMNIGRLGGEAQWVTLCGTHACACVLHLLRSGKSCS